VPRAFDRQLGDGYLETVPRTPGVYRVLDARGEVVYVGKAVNLRRRLAQYRNATRRKKHRKMREIVKSAATIAFEPCASELEAELREATLIRELRPRWNTAMAFSFLYPLIGIGTTDAGIVSIAFSSRPEERPELAWHGAYRSRDITGEAFFALARLLKHVGHREKTSRRSRGERTYAFSFRRLPRGSVDAWAAFLRGEDRTALSSLVLELIEKPKARSDRASVQDDVDALDRFYRHEARRLREVCRLLGEPRWPVPQVDRDALFIRARRVAAAS
jgi:excinuclease ABC subunit C